MKIPFSPPYVDESVINEVFDSLRSGWITTGPKVKALEQEIVRLTGTPAALGVNSWTSGALMMLRWFGIKPGDEVIIPAYTYCATAMAPLWTGAKVVMVDSCDDFNICVQAIRQAITPRTKAILPVDIAGFPCDYDAIMSLVQEPDIKTMFHPDSQLTVYNLAGHLVFRGKASDFTRHTLSLDGVYIVNEVKSDGTIDCRKIRI